MNRNLSPQEFGEQLSMFDGSDFATYGPARPDPAYVPPEDYPDPHAGEGLGVIDAPNPLYDEGAEVDVSSMGDWEDGWVPTWDVASIQPVVNPAAVGHLVQHASGLGEGDVLAVQSKGRHIIYDGNHRMNAAQLRGQLFVPGQVARAD